MTIQPLDLAENVLAAAAQAAADTYAAVSQPALMGDPAHVATLVAGIARCAAQRPDMTALDVCLAFEGIAWPFRPRRRPDCEALVKVLMETGKKPKPPEPDPPAPELVACFEAIVTAARSAAPQAAP